jgi:acetyltransferase-like isoleucine patch superfamily enzyme
MPRSMTRASIAFHDRVLARLWKVALGHEGVDVSDDVRVLGRAIVSMCHGSSISIGARSVLISRSQRTALGVSHPVILRTLLPESRIIIGTDVGLSGTTICAAHSVSIGDRVLLGADVIISDTDFHAVDTISRRYEALPAPRPADEVMIGDDVFIGARSVVLKGASIGSGTVVGAGSVVAGEIPPAVVAAGNPCRPIRPLHMSKS